MVLALRLLSRIERPSECASGTAETFESARAAFMAAWAVFLSKRTEDDFEAWRQERDWTARKCAAWERGERPNPKKQPLPHP